MPSVHRCVVPGQMPSVTWRAKHMPFEDWHCPAVPEAQPMQRTSGPVMIGHACVLHVSVWIVSPHAAPSWDCCVTTSRVR